MSRCIILVQNPALGAALQVSLSSKHEVEKSEIDFCVVGKKPDESRLAVEFHKLAEKLNEHARESRRTAISSHLVVFTDFQGYGSTTPSSTLNPVNPGGGWGTVLGMLILAFPEIQWVFCGGQAPETSFNASHQGSPEKIADALRVRNSGYLPLFDGSGLRNEVRKTARKTEPYLTRRDAVALSMDEESDYALLHAYCAYRNGFRAVSITTRGLAKELLVGGPKKESSHAFSEGFELIFEDIFLSFPDGGGLSNLRTRAGELPRLDEIRLRILVTSDQKTSGDTLRWVENDDFIDERKRAGQKISKLHKPHAGMFDVWQQARLERDLKQTDDDGRIRRGVGPGYVWPPRRFPGKDKGHSAPGLLLIISNHLISRAEALTDSAVISSQDEILGSVLATDALELLGGKTPTGSAKALQMKHAFEVRAECHFSGVEYHIPMRRRLKEIQRDASAISGWFHKYERKRAYLNIQMHVLNCIVGVLRDNNQFDEEQYCMSHARHLHNTLWMRQRPVRYALWPVMRYFELLLSSFSTFVIVLTCWVLFFSWLYCLSAGHHGWVPGLQDAITSFFSIGGPLHQTAESGVGTGGGVYAWTICGAVVLGFIHLGVFISHLYSIVSRK